MKEQVRAALRQPSANNTTLLDHGVFVTWGRNRKTSRKTLVVSVVHRHGPDQDAASWAWTGPMMPFDIYAEFMDTLRAAADEVVDAYGGVSTDPPN